MAAQPLPEKDRIAPTTGVQQYILQQAEAAVAAQTTTQDALPQEAELTISELVGDDVPLPAYGGIYGEVSSGKTDQATSAAVTDDGRVNIRINALNRRLSQVFAPALRQHIQDVQDAQPPPPPYIPSSLEGEEGGPSLPRLNVVIQVVGSRGDVQPFVALGKVLKGIYGHRVRLATHPNFRPFVEEHGLEFFSIGGDPSRLMAFMVKNPGLMPGFRSMLGGDVSQRRRDVAEYIQGCWRSCYEAGDGTGSDSANDDVSELSGNDVPLDRRGRSFVADCIIANPPSFAHIHCAEKLGIPLHIMFTMPYSPTQAFPHPLANIQSTDADPQLTNYISYAMIDLLMWQGLSDIINRFRKKCLALEPISTIWAPGMLQRLKVPHTYCWSPALIPKPRDWGAHISIAGFYFLDIASSYHPASDLQAFLNAGPPPVYIGFGSIVLDDPNAMTELIFEAVKKTGQRVLLSKGWGGMGADELQDRTPDGVFMLGNVPHDWLFKHVSCVVHHGGAGTMAAGITAGRPTVIVPFFGDQPFWGAMIARAGAGPDPIPHKQLTADRLAEAIQFCLKAESLQRAKDLAAKIEVERGNDMGAQLFHQHLEVDRLRCTLAPSRVATWRIKRTQVRLSAFAACTLANASLIDFSDLKLYRAQEYYTDEGPWDPVSGGYTAFAGAVGSMLLGLTEFPSETWKALRLPSGSSRKQSEAPVPSSISGESGTSLNSKRSLARIQNPSNPSGPSSSTSSTRLSPEQDMMRPTGFHLSKGAGRIVKAIAQGPMNISVGLTQGVHNLPKLYGDVTVRPQERVSGFNSGMKAVGREFGYGWYDGLTGVVTQPWRGAQKEGAGGFVKGIGKGIAGLWTKPLAGMLGILSHSMKGVHKEVQKLYGNNVQNSIIVSRVAQGWEEWLQSSDAEKQDVINRWKLVQTLLKYNRTAEEMIQEVLAAQRRDSGHEWERSMTSAPSASGASGLSQDPQSTQSTSDTAQALLRAASTASKESLSAAEVNEAIRLLVQETLHGDTAADANVERAIQEDESQFQRQQHRKEAAIPPADHEEPRQAMSAIETELQRQANEKLEYERQLKQIMAQSLRELRPPLHDPGHLEGTTQSNFEAQQRGQGEKTAEEKMEEKIVLEYVRKQSLLETHHKNKSKCRAAGEENADDDR